jgi:paraquat-inducible protein B
MSRKANPTLIGAFVLGAIALLIAGILIWSTGFGEHRPRFVMYFDESVKGLDVGAPVLFQGVQIGSVVDIQLRVDPREPRRVIIPVVVETEGKRFRAEGDVADVQKALGPYIEEGLRAQLDLQSFVTGRLLIEFVYAPEKPALFRGAGLDLDLPEIPTVQTPLQELQNTLQEIDIKPIAERLLSVAESLDRLLSAPEAQGSLRALNASLRNIETLAANLDARTERLSHALEGGLEEARDLFNDGRLTLEELRGLSAEARAAIEQANVAAANVRALTDEDSPAVYQLTIALQELTAASRSVQELADTLEHRPESLLFGKD